MRLALRHSRPRHHGPARANTSPPPDDTHPCLWRCAAAGHAITGLLALTPRRCQPETLELVASVRLILCPPTLSTALPVPIRELPCRMGVHQLPSGLTRRPTFRCSKAAASPQSSLARRPRGSASVAINPRSTHLFAPSRPCPSPMRGTSSVWALGPSSAAGVSLRRASRLLAPCRGMPHSRA